MVRRHRTKADRELQTKATWAASFWFSSVGTLAVTLLAGVLYTAVEHWTNLPIRPASTLLDSPFKHDWSVNATSVIVMTVIYMVVVALQANVLVTCFDASYSFRVTFGYEPLPEDIAGMSATRAEQKGMAEEHEDRK
ncbi:hypothetical protein KC331_g230 [Hortaea werneckii]|nr:hypothetical protein KC331_g230 [Hortaea werneckii]KAI7722704.1 hypothetical protein KC353_g267 [Hortaea werneckii]